MPGQTFPKLSNETLKRLLPNQILILDFSLLQMRCFPFSRVKKRKPALLGSYETCRPLSNIVLLPQKTHHPRNAAEGVKIPPLRPTEMLFHHINEVIMEARKGIASFRCNLHPVADALQWGIIGSREQGRVGQQTPGRHYAYR